MDVYYDLTAFLIFSGKKRGNFVFKKENNNFSKPAIFLATIVIVSAALFITVKSLFSERSAHVISDSNGKHSFFEKEGESKLFASSISPSQRSDSISILLKANEGYASSAIKSDSNRIQEKLPSAMKDTSTSAISDFEKQALAELGEAETPQEAKKDIGGSSAKSIESLAEEQNIANIGARKNQSRSKSSLSGKKSAFTSHLSAINNFNKLRIGKNFKSQGDSGDISQTFEQTSNGAYLNSNFNSSGNLGLNSSMGSQGNSGSYASSDANTASNSAGRTDEANKPKPDIPRPQMMVYKQVYDFGNVNLYEYARRLVTVMNVGKKDLRIGRINKLNYEDNSFYVTKNNCSNRTLKPATECTFQIVFRPYHSGTASDGFEIESNDADRIPYSNYIEVSGKSSSSRPRYNSYWNRTPSEKWWYTWLHRYEATTEMDFGTVTSGHSLELNYLFVSDVPIYGLHFVKDSSRKENSAFSVSYTNCPDNKVIGQWRPCLVRIKFTPTDSLLKYLSSNYGKYYAVNGYNGNKQLMDNPVYPPNVIDRPFELELKGYIRAKAKVNYSLNSTTVRTIPLRAFTSSRYPNPRLKRVAEENLYSF